MHRLSMTLEPNRPADHAGLASTERLVAETTSEVLWSGVVGGSTLAVSGGVHRVCGFSVDEILGMAGNVWLDRAHPADATRVEDAFRLLIVTGAPLDVEYRWQHGDGAWLWLRGRAVLRGVADAPIVDAVFVDISRQEELEEQVRHLQKVEIVGQFTGGIAHDFNNLLAVILGSTALLLDVLPEGDPCRADVDAITDAAQRAAGLTKQLLAFTRQHAYEPRILDVNEIVGGAEKMLRRVIGEDIDFSMDLSTGLGSVRSDAGLLEQVVMNLVLNARDAMPSGGKLSIETSQVTLDSVPHVRLAVSDTGCGMDSATRHRVFEPFFTTKADGQGTGLGLSTCQAIVKQAGGLLRVDSEPGQGSVFEVLLPIINEAIDASGLPATAPAGAYAGRETILVVEDDAGVRALVHRMLARVGYRVLCAASGQEAFAIMSSTDEPIDLVLCDVVMPNLTGAEVVSRVQARSRDTRALFMSGHTTDSLVRRGTLQEGCPFIRKPFMPSGLAKKVREVLDA